MIFADRHGLVIGPLIFLANDPPSGLPIFYALFVFDAKVEAKSSGTKTVAQMDRNAVLPKAQSVNYNISGQNLHLPFSLPPSRPDPRTQGFKFSSLLLRPTHPGIQIDCSLTPLASIDAGARMARGMLAFVEGPFPQFFPFCSPKVRPYFPLSRPDPQTQGFWQTMLSI